jgi:hypothetical protein
MRQGIPISTLTSLYIGVRMMFRLIPVLGLAAAVILASEALAQGCDPVDKLVTTTAAPPHDLESWRTFAREADAISGMKVKTQPIDLVLIGDSLAQAWDDKSWRTHPVGTAVRISIAALALDGEWRSDAPTASGIALREIFSRVDFCERLRTAIEFAFGAARHYFRKMLTWSTILRGMPPRSGSVATNGGAQTQGEYYEKVSTARNRGLDRAFR